MLNTLRSLFIAILVGATSAAYAISINYSVVPATCGECNGSILAGANGGTGPYTYAWTPVPPAGQGTSQISGLCAGTYAIEVWDSMGESVTVFIDVLDLPGLNMTGALAASYVTAACPAQCNGELILNESQLGGTGPFTFVTNPPMPLSALCGDTPFDLTVTDMNGCSGTLTTVVPETVVSSLLYTEVNGPCGGAPTSVVAYFDVLPADMYVTTAGGAPMPATIVNGGVSINGGMPGVYTITEMSVPPCPDNNYNFIYPATVTDCANVSGDLFVDVNGDCANNAGDFGLPNRTVTIAPGYATLTGPSGHYQRQLPDGTYDLSHTDPVYTQDCPVASPVNFTVDQVTPAIIDLAFTPGPDPDVSITCAFDAAVVGFPQHVWLTLTNNSGVMSGPITVTLDHDPILTYCQFWFCLAPPYGLPLVLPYPTSFTTGQLAWDLDEGLAPGETRVLTARLCVPPDVLLLGTNFNYTATAITALNDADLSNNTCTHTETVVGSYDPNDKQARTTSGSATEWSLENDSLITYTIRFQNTGTAPAINVVLIDTLSEDFDLASLRVLGASHTFSAALTGRVLSFTFDHIMLPDSTMNEAGSHGFAQLSIAPVSMSPGSSVENFADIYFDFNPPVRTNTSVVSAPLNTSIPEGGLPALLPYPDPATDVLYLGITGIKEGLITTIDGRIVATFGRVDRSIDVSALAPGVYVLRVTAISGDVRNARFVKE